MEEKQLIELVRQNDEKAFRTLLVKYEKFIYKNIATLNLECSDFKIDRQDLYQEACLALYTACMTYRFDMDCKFSSFAYLVIRRKLISYYKKSSTPLKHETRSIDKINEQYFLRFLLDNPEERAKEEKEQLQKTLDYVDYFMQTLSNKEKEIVNERLKKKSFADISKELNINPKTLYYRAKRIKEKFAEFKQQMLNLEEYEEVVNI